MAQLFNATITSAGTATGSVMQLRAGAGDRWTPGSLAVQSNFTYGSGGTSVDVYIQTSLDGGSTWCDVIHFAQLTTSNSRAIATVNSGKSVTPAAATDGSLTAGTVNDGLFGPLWRVKVVSVGTYGGNTTLVVTASGIGLAPQ